MQPRLILRLRDNQNRMAVGIVSRFVSGARVCVCIFRLIAGFCCLVESEGCRMYLHALPGSPQTRLSPVNPLPTVQCCCALNAAAKNCYSLLVDPQCTSTVPLRISLAYVHLVSIGVSSQWLCYLLSSWVSACPV